ncbi:MAG: tetratricopeptide repeat protein [Luteolibacter sp.]
MESKRHMLEGIALMEQGEWQTALGHFEKAIEIREALPWRSDVESAWVLAAAWINRSDVLRMLGNTDEGILSLDRAIEAMQHVPLETNAGYADRLILAWINRATACGEADRMADALAGFSKAEELLETWGGTPTPGRKLMASMLHANRARVLLEMGSTVGSWQSARLAVDFLKISNDLTGPAAEAAIKARGILCRALAMLLNQPDGIALAQDWIARATDSAEEALAISRSSGYRGAWIADLVRYGAKIYRVCQPHFLAEFIREWTTGDGPLSDDGTLKREMAGELLLAQADLERRVRLAPHETKIVSREIKTLSTLQIVQKELTSRTL